LFGCNPTRSRLVELSLSEHVINTLGAANEFTLQWHMSRNVTTLGRTEVVKMVNGFRYYRALESVSIASALSTALTIYPCHIRSESINADSLNSNFLQLGRRSGGRPQRTVHPRRFPVNTV